MLLIALSAALLQAPTPADPIATATKGYESCLFTATKDFFTSKKGDVAQLEQYIRQDCTLQEGALQRWLYLAARKRGLNAKAAEAAAEAQLQKHIAVAREAYQGYRANGLPGSASD